MHESINPFITKFPYHIETSPMICRANQRIGFYMIGASVMKELKQNFIKLSTILLVHSFNFVFPECPNQPFLMKSSSTTDFYKLNTV